MGETKTKVRFFTIADYEEEENWLRREHQNGWKLIKTFGPCFYHFEKCTPEDVIYRLDCKNGPGEKDYMQMFADYGWEYFNELAGWLYFRKAASKIESEQEGEIFSDNESKTDMLQKIMRTRMLPLFITFICCLVPAWLQYQWDTEFKIFLTVLVILYTFLIMYCGLKLRKLKKKYAAVK